MTRNVINILWMQALWFVAVIAAAQGLFWPAPLLLILFVLWQSRPANRAQGDYQLVLVAVLLGLILDTTWIKFGWFEFAADWPITDRAPLWILLLWH